MNKQIYFFSESSKADVDLLGGKGANLGEMMRLKIPVPAGFTITTKVCNEYLENRHGWPKGLEEALEESLAALEKEMGKRFGGSQTPLLVSVRSGAKVSMPGMMDTVLNLGLNDETVQGLIKNTGNKEFGWDAYRRFIQMFSNVVLGLDMEPFEKILETEKDLEKVVTIFKNMWNISVVSLFHLTQRNS